MSKHEAPETPKHNATISLNLRVWRQERGSDRGAFALYEVNDIPVDASFLEMLDILNEQLNNKGEDSIAFESDCREGICGTFLVQSQCSQASWGANLEADREDRCVCVKNAHVTILYELF